MTTIQDLFPRDAAIGALIGLAMIIAVLLVIAMAVRISRSAK